ncbi:zf-DHHC-domain-containing protein [Laetiporus sulphureus 93-53]|uniref:Palmitoyltransferase PFA4 n=1 Tax=Laetiporus sulphureus 93-53 TaxID=1314785 RepID=A0A165FBK9_9APHY|nr:zf-DHHC-domain-containing protein [Laetiporus sulphureus 93-53]KZT08720.1 zf-DHHC-domain-containing protein [Laetiporus sulphureus 93-53]
MGRLTGRLFVGFVLCLICFIAYSSQIFIIWPWYGRELSVELLSLLVPFNTLVGMLLWNYYLCVVTDPGTAPERWQPDVQDSDGYEVKKLTRRPRYCRTCEAYKPPRAHHCKQCKRCILRMDHHCPWVNNCVGHFNYGYFIRFLFYVDLACSYHFAMVTRRVYVATQTWMIFIILNFATCIPVLLAVGSFSLYHFYVMSCNTTTIEGWEKDKVATLVRHGKIQEIKFPYNLGIKRNICSVLGDSPLWWCWPTVPPGTGLKYQLAEGDDSTAEAWPPEDPTKVNQLPEPDPNYQFNLPSSPWTYSNGSLNPNLQPSNAHHRSTSRRRSRGVATHSPLPPYHPDYHESQDDPSYIYDPSSEEEDLDDTPFGREFAGGAARVRRGSEGYEVKTIDREAMLRMMVDERIQAPGRYQQYVAEQYGDDEEGKENLEDFVPLAKTGRTEGVRT